MTRPVEPVDAPLFSSGRTLSSSNAHSVAMGDVRRVASCGSVSGLPETATPSSDALSCGALQFDMDVIYKQGYPERQASH